MIEGCGLCEQKTEATKLFQEMKKEQIEPSIETLNAYFQACGKRRALMIGEEVKSIAKRSEVAKLVYDSIIELPNKCGNPACNFIFKEEELMSCWIRNLNNYTVNCPECNKGFVPNLEVTTEQGKTSLFYFLFPPLFAKEVNNIIEFKSLSVFFSVTPC